MSLDYLFSLEKFGIKFGLDNIRAILARMGNPERSFRSVHIAGTNGKGSVTAMVDAGLRAAGHRTGRYTSPHLIDLTERFAVDGRAIDRASMIQTIEAVREAIEELRRAGALDVLPTFFEATTAVALELFRREAVEVAVVEVGLGGRLDATNVITPEVTAITSIALDHQLYLGSTLREIAREKAGVIKNGVPVIVGPLDPEAAEAIEEVARERGAPIVRAHPADVGSRAVGLRGDHQRANAAVALRLLEALDGRGVRVPAGAIDAGLARPDWAGRLDVRRLADGRELILDAAHNPAGAEALAAYLREQAAGSPGGRTPLVFAVMRDKDVAGMLRALLPEVESVVFTRASNARAADPHDLARVARTLAPSATIAVEPSIPDALERAWRSRSRILVAGSIFLLGDVMKHLGLHC